MGIGNKLNYVKHIKQSASEQKASSITYGWKKWNLHLLRFHKKLLGKSICQVIDNIFGKKYKISDNILKKMKIDNNEVFVECFCNAKISEI